MPISLPADAHGFYVPRVQNRLLEFSAKDSHSLRIYISATMLTMLTLKIITEFPENHSEFYVRTNNYNKFVSSRS